MRTESSDRYFELKERARKLAEKSHSIAYALTKCGFCYGAGSVAAVDWKNVDGRTSKVIVKPVEHLPCVCTVGWPFYEQGDGYDGPEVG
jgi:hypothetical protein